MRMFIAGEWVDRDAKIEVTNPYDGSVVDTVPQATPADVEKTLAAAVQGAAVMRELPGYERFKILRKTADLLAARQQELGKLISQEEGKTLAEGVFEVTRARRNDGGTIGRKRSKTTREAKSCRSDGRHQGSREAWIYAGAVPCGVIVAITPFNFPLNLVCHKVVPSMLAAGNAVILKPATDTPLTALRLTEILLEAGLPPLALQCLTGRGGEIGDMLCTRTIRVRKISFTGSSQIGRRICANAGIKRVTMELGSNSPLIVLEDADLTKVAAAIVATGYGNAGQVCISTQRVIAVNKIHGDLIDVLRPSVAAITTGNPLLAETKMGPMIRERDAERVSDWIAEAVRGGAKVACGGEREGTRFSPTLVTDAHPEMRICKEELFGPAVAVMRASDIDTAITLANDSPYGLSAGIFTQNIDAAMKFARRVESGNLHINWGPGWRADLIPYGGLKESGFGKEGPKYAIHEMTELKTVVLHG